MLSTHPRQIPLTLCMVSTIQCAIHTSQADSIDIVCMCTYPRQIPLTLCVCPGTCKVTVAATAARLDIPFLNAVACEHLYATAAWPRAVAFRIPGTPDADLNWRCGGNRLRGCLHKRISYTLAKMTHLQCKHTRTQWNMTITTQHNIMVSVSTVDKAGFCSKTSQHASAFKVHKGCVVHDPACCDNN